jgi:FkbM family methyltransferase
MIHSNLPYSGSGYGTQTAHLCRNLPAFGHEVAVSPTNGLDGQPIEWEGTLCLPSGIKTYSNDMIGPHARRLFGADPGLVLVLYDAWAIDPNPLSEFPSACWTPVHSSPLSPADRQFFQISGALPIAMSRFGERELTEAGLQPIYVPHCIDTDVFRPHTAEERAIARDMLKIPQDAFVIAMVAANKDKSPPRKGWGEQFQAFARFRKRHSDAVLLVHTMMNPAQGVDLTKLAFDLDIQESVQFTDQYSQLAGLYTPADVAAMMGCADVLSNCAWGEGFGLPILEAQACGTPVVVSDSSSMRELCGSGWKVETQPYWHPYAESWWAAPIIREIVKAYEKAYRHAEETKVRAAAREFALTYSVDTVMDRYWKPAMAMLEQYAGAAPVHLNGSAMPLPTVESDGLKWIQRATTTDDWIAVNHEDSLGPVMAGLLPDGGVFVDVGAHIGRWSLRLAKKASRVIAVEPNPDTAAVLRAHIALNDIKNVNVFEMAAWDCETLLALRDPKVTSGSTQVVEGDDGMTVAVPLDEILSVVTPDLIKLDVEGADLHALRGMRETLARARPTLFIEDHSIYGHYQRAELENLLRELNYRWRSVHGYRDAGGRNIQAPYLVAVPVDGNNAFEVALQACVQHGASQRPDELAGVMRLIDGSPVVVEIGCDSGGTLFAWKQVAGEVYGITLADNSYDTGGSGQPLNTHDAMVYRGDSHHPLTKDWLECRLAGRRIDALVLDGDHSVAGIHADLNDYGPLVRPGGVILLHDIASEDDDRAEVWKVWPDLQKQYRTSEIRSADPPCAGWGVIHVENDTKEPSHG